MFSFLGSLIFSESRNVSYYPRTGSPVKIGVAFVLGALCAGAATAALTGSFGQGGKAPTSRAAETSTVRPAGAKNETAKVEPSKAEPSKVETTKVGAAAKADGREAQPAPAKAADTKTVDSRSAGSKADSKTSDSKAAEDRAWRDCANKTWPYKGTCAAVALDGPDRVIVPERAGSNAEKTQQAVAVAPAVVPVPAADPRGTEPQQAAEPEPQTVAATQTEDPAPATPAAAEAEPDRPEPAVRAAKPAPKRSARRIERSNRELVRIYEFPDGRRIQVYRDRRTGEEISVGGRVPDRYADRPMRRAYADRPAYERPRRGLFGPFGAFADDDVY